MAGAPCSNALAALEFLFRLPADDARRDEALRLQEQAALPARLNALFIKCKLEAGGPGAVPACGAFLNLAPPSDPRRAEALQLKTQAERR